jgi:replicative DNA helicase
MSLGLELLASVAIQGSSETLRELFEDLFIEGEERQVYQYMLRYQRRYQQIPALRVVEENTSVALPEPSGNTNYLLDQLYDRLMYNAVRTPFHGLRQALSEADTDSIRDSVGELRRAVQRTTRATYGGVSTLNDLGHALLSQYETRANALGLTGVSTGWPYLDDETGGYQNGDFVAYVARTSIGKTWVLVYQAYQAYLQGKSVLVVSTEMTKAQLAARFMSMVAAVDPSMVRKGRLCYWGRRRYREAVENFADPERFGIYAGNIGRTTDDVDSIIEESNPDIIFIDGFYLLKPVSAGRGAGRFEKVYYVTDEIRNISLSRDRPVIVSTQFNRQSGSKGAGGSLETIAYADAIATHTTLAVSLKEGTVPGTRDMELLKGREGERGSWSIRYGFTPPDFRQLSSEEMAQMSDQGRRVSRMMTSML